MSDPTRATFFCGIEFYQYTPNSDSTDIPQKILDENLGDGDLQEWVSRLITENNFQHVKIGSYGCDSNLKLYLTVKSFTAYTDLVRIPKDEIDVDYPGMVEITRMIDMLGLDRNKLSWYLGSYYGYGQY